MSRGTHRAVRRRVLLVASVVLSACSTTAPGPKTQQGEPSSGDVATQPSSGSLAESGSPSTSGSSAGRSSGSGAGLSSGTGLGPSSGSLGPSSGSVFQGSGSVAASGTASGSGSGTSAGGSGSSLQTAGMPCLVQALLEVRCLSCHGPEPILPAPNSLDTVADMTAPSLVDQSKTNAEESVVRMEDTYSPMPPPPALPATTEEIAALKSWIAAKYPASSGCSPDGGLGDISDASTGGPPWDGGLVCSSGGNYTSGNGPAMRPGDSCHYCHNFTIAGTVYKTEHEPFSCAGAAVTGANVVITDDNGTVTTVPVQSAGNFYTTAPIVGPFHAKLVYQGREREMMAPQGYGSCNDCHTDVGANGAPGRIALP